MNLKPGVKTLAKKMNSVFIKNRLGLNISANVFFPEENNPQKLAILLPGFLDTKDYPHLIKLGEDLSKIGYLTISLDPSGTWDSEGSIEIYSISQYLKDVRAAIGFAKNNYNSTFKEIILLGHSLGGFVSVLFASQNTNENIVKVIALMSSYKIGFDKWEDKGSRFSKRDIPDSLNKFKEFTVPFSFVEDSMYYNLLNEVAKVKIPKLFIAGKKDTGVTPELVKELYDKALEPKQIKVISGVEHNYRLNKEDIEIVNKEVIEFLK